MKTTIKWMLAFLLFPMFTVAQEKVVVNDPNAQVREVGSFSEISVSEYRLICQTR
jgi:hypothetical protein